MQHRDIRFISGSSGFRKIHNVSLMLSSANNIFFNEHFISLDVFRNGKPTYGDSQFIHNILIIPPRLIRLKQTLRKRFFSLKINRNTIAGLFPVPKRRM